MVKIISSEDYTILFNKIKSTIQNKQLEALRKTNRVLINLYWNVGKIIVESQQKKGWGKAVVKNLSKDLQKEYPGVRGFSVQNLWYMRIFYLDYHDKDRFVKLVEEISWSHHLVILSKVKEWTAREYYIRAVRKYGWTKNVLIHQIESGNFERFVLSYSHNFSQTLPRDISSKAKLSVKDHYIFDFLEMGNDYDESQLEQGLIQHLQEFILELGHGEFAFMGRQFKITVGDEEFYLDLLFYNRTLHALVAVELKVKKFRPEYAGKMNFYLTALDKQIKKEDENPSIGIILCKEKNKTVVEYAFSKISNPMGVATYGLKKTLPGQYKGVLPSPKELQREIEKWDKQKILTPEIDTKNEILPSLNKRQIKFLKSVQLQDSITTSQYATILYAISLFPLL